MAGAVLKKMGEAFKPHLEQGDTVKVKVHKTLSHTHTTFVPDSKIPVQVRFGPNKEYGVSGLGSD